MSATAMAACCCSGFHRPAIFIGPFVPRQLESSSCRRRSRHEILQISAIFWKPKRTTEKTVLNPSLGTCTLIGSAPEAAMSGNKNSSHQISLSVVSSILDMKSEDWDTCASDANGRGKFDPFTSHAFLSSLEESGSAVQKAEKILRAPNIMNDYYLNLLDWGSSNVLAIALGYRVYLWTASNGSASKLFTVEEDLGPVTSVSSAPDGQHIAVGLNNSHIRLWDSTNNRLVQVDIENMECSIWF